MTENGELSLDPTLYTGRPREEEGRAEKERRCYDRLDRLGIPYQRLDHAPAETIPACAAVERRLGSPICKNLFLRNRQGTEFYLLLLPGEKTFHTKTLSHALGVSRLSFAGAEEMERLLDITPGSVSVLGLMNDRERRVRLLLDREVTRGEYICCHPCLNTSTLKLKTADLLEKFLPSTGHEATVVDLDEE